MSLNNQLSIIIISLGILLLVFSEGNFKKINLKGLIYSLIVALIIIAYTITDAKELEHLMQSFIFCIILHLTVLYLILLQFFYLKK